MSLLEVQDVTVRFGGHTALSRVSLSAGSGTITGLIGPNGAGKTTMFNVITGLLDADAGPGHHGRHGTSASCFRTSARGSGWPAPSSGSSFSASSRCARTSRWPAGLRKQWGRSSAALEGRPPTVDELLARVGLTEVADVRADSLPTGQGRLVELARALAIRPRLLLLDEPASGQDEEETKAFAALLHSLAGEGMAILLVEHDMELVMQVCSHIFVLDFGQLMAEGDPRGAGRSQGAGCLPGHRQGGGRVSRSRCRTDPALSAGRPTSARRAALHAGQPGKGQRLVGRSLPEPHARAARHPRRLRRHRGPARRRSRACPPVAWSRCSAPTAPASRRCCEIVAGLHPPSSGDLYLAGRRVNGVDPVELARAGLCTIPEGRGSSRTSR